MSDLPARTGSIAATSAGSMRTPSDGVSFVLTARQILTGAQVLADSSVATALPGALLAGQAIEGALKALLWTKGQTITELRKGFSHDLVALWKATAKAGFPVSISPPIGVSV